MVNESIATANQNINENTIFSCEKTAPVPGTGKPRRFQCQRLTFGTATVPGIEKCLSKKSY
jgi:hypothetical protein